MTAMTVPAWLTELVSGLHGPRLSTGQFQRGKLQDQVEPGMERFQPMVTLRSFNMTIHDPGKWMKMVHFL